MENLKAGFAPKSDNKVLAVHFAPDSLFNTSYKRLKYIRQMGYEPMKRVHKTATGWKKYRIVEYKKNKNHYIIKRNGGVNIVMEY